MTTHHCMGFVGCLIIIGLCFYIKHSFTPHPLHEELVKLIINFTIFSFSVFAIVKLYFYLKNLIFAVMDETGISFKNGFGSLGFVPWNDIKSANKDVVWVYQVIGSGKHSRIEKREIYFYVIISTDYHVYPSIQLNPKHGGIARTIPYPDSRFEDMLYFYRPDLAPEIRVDEE